ncbi:MAG: hypothetical protein M3Y65_13200 [Pseudomonadota bacterium]|nr:hypothetical protein [Pseudomonadota bacterium]
MPWLSLVGYGLLIMLYGTLLSFLLPAAWQVSFKQLLLAAPLLLIVAKDFACLPLALQRLKLSSARGESYWRRLLAALPPEFLAYTRLERAMWRGFFSWVLRRQPDARPTGTPLGYLERGSYRTVICCLLLALFVEMPIDAFIVSLLAKNSAQGHMLHLLFGVLVLYSVVWIMGDRWYVLGRRHHVLTATTLALDMGARGWGSIPLDAIASCEKLNESRKQWCQRHAFAVHATRTLSPCDAPNLVVLLKPGSDVRLHLLQLERGGDGPIFLYLDTPAQFMAGMQLPLSVQP